MEHRSSTSACHLTLFCAVALASCHVRCLSSSSAILLRLQVCWGLPFLLFPCGFNSRALLATCPSGLLSVWPIQPQALVLSFPLLVAALFASKAPHYGFSWATKSAAGGGGGGGSPLYGLYRYVRPQRVWFFSRFGHK